MNIADWQKRLTDNFSFDGHFNGSRLSIFNMERLCGEHFTRKYHGQKILMDSFQGFFMQSIEASLESVRKNGWPQKAENFSQILLYNVILFRSFRASENLLQHGYPYDGYALLRDLKDRTIFLAGIAHNITTFPKIFGYAGISDVDDEEWHKIKRRQKKEEFRVLDRIIRKNSTLPENVTSELEKWEKLFHEEVHGSKFSFFEELGSWARDGNPLTIGPIARETSVSMYMNRASEIAWLIVRLMPYMQPVESAFGNEWSERQKILDDSFLYMQKSLSNVGKKIGGAYIQFVKEKFTFPEPFYYTESTGDH